MSSSIFVCELSGEAITTTNGEHGVVVTPSGHICRRSLLLRALSENGGYDPFHKDRPLSEHELIQLHQPTQTTPPRSDNSNDNTNNNKNSIVPPLMSGSMTQTIQMIQSEYDAVVLELYNTRQKLYETRMELTQALYQNDAAVRVVARLAMERDQARTMILDDENRTNLPSNPDTKTTTSLTKEMERTNPNNADTEVEEQHTTKRLKGDNETNETINNNNNNIIPEQDLQGMIAVWQELHPTRKARQKVKQSISPMGWHLLLEGPTSVSLGTILIEYVTTHTTCVDWWKDTIHGRDKLVIGSMDGSIHIPDQQLSCTIATSTTRVVDTRFHPDQQHIIAATEDGKVTLCRYNDTTISIVAIFLSPMSASTTIKAINYYTSGALHPDGLIYIVGTSDGKLELWDFKSQTLAATLQTQHPMTIITDAVQDISVSQNGYHIAVVYTNNIVVVWDLRKQNVLASFNQADDCTDENANQSTNKDILHSVNTVAFDDAGKYMAYAGIDNHQTLTICIVEVKKWDIVERLKTEKECTPIRMVYGDTWLVVGGVTPVDNSTHTFRFGPP